MVSATPIISLQVIPPLLFHLEEQPGWSGQFPIHQPHLKIEPFVEASILDEASRVTAAVARGLLSFRAHAGLLCSRAFSSRPPAQQTASSAAPTSSFRSATSKLLQSPHPLPAAPPIPKWNQPSKLDCIHAIEHGGNKNKKITMTAFFLLWYIFIL